MGGGTKQQMKENADRHFDGVRQVVPAAQRLMLFDFDTTETAFHPEHDNAALYEWHRKNIENYLIVPGAWERAVSQALGCLRSDLDAEGFLDDLFAGPAMELIRAFFASQNLSLPPGQNWRNVAAEVFRVVNGKNLLFEAEHSLFQQLREGQPPAELPREMIAGCMITEEIHDDVGDFFARLQALVQRET